MRTELILETAEQLGALAHPLRQRILTALQGTPRTNKQLATLLRESPARLHFHVRELAQAGLIQQVEARPKGGVIEKYYQAVAGSFRLGPALGAARPGGVGPASGALAAAQEELAHAIEQFGLSLANTQVTHERAHLTAEALARVQVHLEAITEEFHMAAEQPAGQEHEQPMVFTCLFHPAAVD
jgi:DNA-binding transcriptional ArsR family regulator